eukprot:m.114623 g.114623  ORF g.114623 m.114623 type:complete len:724 (-) comp9453_c0_seq2:46-2217(-)
MLHWLRSRSAAAAVSAQGGQYCVQRAQLAAVRRSCEPHAPGFYVIQSASSSPLPVLRWVGDALTKLPPFDLHRHSTCTLALAPSATLLYDSFSCDLLMLDGRVARALRCGTPPLLRSPDSPRSDACDMTVRNRAAAVLASMLGKDAVYRLNHRVGAALRFVEESEDAARQRRRRSSSLSQSQTLASASGTQTSTGRFLDATATRRQLPADAVRDRFVEWIGQADRATQLQAVDGLLRACSIAVLQPLHDSLVHTRRSAALTISALPKPLILRILSLLAPEDRAAASAVSRAWHRAIKLITQEQHHRIDAVEFGSDLKAQCDPSWERMRSMTRTTAAGASVSESVLERNVFCGPHSVIAFRDEHDSTRATDGPTDAVAVSGGASKTITVWDTLTGEPLQTMSGHAGSIRSLFFDRENRRIFSGSYDTSIRCWDLKTGTCPAVLQGHRHTVTAVDFDGESTVVSASSDMTVRIWNLDEESTVHTIMFSSPVHSVKFNAEFLAAGCADGTLGWFQREEWKQLAYPAKHEESINDLSLGKYFLATASDDHCCRVFAPGPELVLQQSLKHPSEVLSVLQSHLRVVTGCADGRVRIWNPRSGECLKMFLGCSLGSPVRGIFSTSPERLIINTSTKLVLFKFEAVRAPRQPPTAGLTVNVKDGTMQRAATLLRQRRRRINSQPSISAPLLEGRKQPLARSFSGEWRTTLREMELTSKRKTSMWSTLPRNL